MSPALTDCSTPPSLSVRQQNDKGMDEVAENDWPPGNYTLANVSLSKKN